MIRVAIISDTHIPSRAERIPEWVVSEVEDADHIIHAGDFDSGEALDTVRDLAESSTVVSGNMDRGLGLPETATVELGGVEFVVTHGAGDFDGYEERVADIVREESEDAVGVSGHTHQVLDREVDGVRLLNPGSATGADPATVESMMVAEADGGTLDVTAHEQ